MEKKIVITVTPLGPVNGPIPLDVIKEYFPKEVPKQTKEVSLSINNPDSINFYINRIANKIGWKYKKVEGYLANLKELSPESEFRILLKEIAVYLDESYKDHINKASEIFAISSINGQIGKINKAKVKTFRNFAAFRSIEDAKKACRILSERIRNLYKG